jgi:hypothetical protein
MRLYVQDSIFLRDFSDADLGSTITPPPLQISEFTSAFRTWMQGMGRPYAVTLNENYKKRCLPKATLRLIPFLSIDTWNPIAWNQPRHTRP